MSSRSTHVQPIRFVQDFFNYRALHIQKQIPSDTGYAGFRLLNQLNRTDQWDELGSFLGASYFRLLGKEQRYGLSARGLALDCGETDRPGGISPLHRLVARQTSARTPQNCALCHSRQRELHGCVSISHPTRAK